MSRFSLRLATSHAVVFLLVGLLSACGGGGSGSSSEPSASDPSIPDPSAPDPSLPEPSEPEPSDGVSERPLNQISQAYFRDQNPLVGEVSGEVVIAAADVDDSDPARVESVQVYWADDQGDAIGEAWLATDATDVYGVELPLGALVPDDARALLLYPANGVGQAEEGTLVRFHDFTGNAALSGPGGNYEESWYYGEDRPTIAVHRTPSAEGGTCVFDNGLVSVVDMANERDEGIAVPSDNQELSSNDDAIQADDAAFPPYEFVCDENPVNTHREVSDDFGIWTWSTINDSMYYGTLVYDTFLKYLGEPPLNEKIRLRVHYGSLSSQYAYWDGAYANFSDGYPFQYSMAPLDALAHEIGHGVLNRIANLNMYEYPVSEDTRTVHEAFADISGMMAKYALTGHTDNWVHGEEARGRVRHLDRIKTEEDAIASLLDYQQADGNFYLRIGMMTYPFYLLSSQWGIETAYDVYVDAARHCWQAMMSLTDAAECIKERAVARQLPEADVVDAFKTVKIALFEEGVLSHYTARAFKLRTVLTDNSQSTNQVTQWLWDLGDGQQSTAASLEHVYAEPGEYRVNLTVTDQSGDQDSFARTLTVTDQYCRIWDSSEVHDRMVNVAINGVDLGYDDSRWDYTANPIELADSSAVSVSIQGNTQATEKSTTWRIWIDLNDDGVFGDESEELVLDQWAEEDQPYALDTVLDLSAFPGDGEPKHMRVLGTFGGVTPCTGAVGEALDVRVVWSS